MYDPFASRTLYDFEKKKPETKAVPESIHRSFKALIPIARIRIEILRRIIGTEYRFRSPAPSKAP